MLNVTLGDSQSMAGNQNFGSRELTVPFPYERKKQQPFPDPV